jgi:hypothetical protein
MKNKCGALGRADTCPERRRGVKSASSSEAKIPRHEAAGQTENADARAIGGADLQSASPTPSRRRLGARPGAPRGNKNAYKHGFYSAAFKAEERRLLEQVPVTDLAAEIELVRVTSYRFVQALNALKQPLDIETQLAALRAVNLSAQSIVSLLRAQGNLKLPLGTPRQAGAGFTIPCEAHHGDPPSPMEGSGSDNA